MLLIRGFDSLGLSGRVFVRDYSSQADRMTRSCLAQLCRKGDITQRDGRYDPDKLDFDTEV